MILKAVFFILSASTMSNALPTAHSWKSTENEKPTNGNRPARSYTIEYPFPIWEDSSEPLWPSYFPAFIPSRRHSFQFPKYTIDRNDHITPDFSDGLDYPDPFLLRGPKALAAVQNIYGRGELFFHNIPHVKLLLRNQEERKANGLAENRLNSLRPSSPFFRDGYNNRFSRY